MRGLTHRAGLAAWDDLLVAFATCLASTFGRFLVVGVHMGEMVWGVPIAVLMVMPMVMVITVMVALMMYVCSQVPRRDPLAH